MKKYEVIAFDLYGTLTEPSKGIIASYKYAHDKMNLPYNDPSEFKRFIGPPIRDVWTKTHGLSDEEAELATKYYREYFAVHGWCDNEIFDGVPEMLKTLKERGKKIVIATSKPEHFAVKILQLFKIDQYFDFIGGATMDASRNTKESVLEYALNSVGVKDEFTRKTAILVGDRIFDCQGAKACGIDSLGVLFGHGSYEEITSCGFTYIAKTVKDIINILI